jgi:hypothetical protein
MSNSYFQDFENMDLASTTRSHAIDHMISMARFDYAEMKALLANDKKITPSQKFVNLILSFLD